MEIAERQIQTMRLLYDIGGVSQSELEDAENNAAKIKLQYVQYLQSEKENKESNLKSYRAYV